MKHWSLKKAFDFILLVRQFTNIKEISQKGNGAKLEYEKFSHSNF